MGAIPIPGAMLTTILELWNDEWWRWYLKDGIPYAFLKEHNA